MDFTFFDWSYLATFAGCLLAVGIFTELFKNIGFIKKIPTQIFSWVLALIVLVLAHAGAALYHHIHQRDATLARMLPQGWLNLPQKDSA